jgi:hypothetical protein
MRRATLGWARALACVFALATGAPASAGGRLPCHAVHVFEGAAVNALVLPYRDARSDRQLVGSVGARLSMLIQQETLFALLKYGSVGVTEVTSQDRVCEVREVIARLTSGSGPGTLAPGHGVVLLWGRLYEENDELYVQSYIRFLRRGEAETIDATLEAATPLVLRAALPAQAVALVPRRVTKADLREIEQRARGSLMLHAEPRDGASRRPLAGENEPLSYGVLRTQGDWMQVRSIITGQTGWLRARTDSEAWALRRFLPELGYLDAVAGYLRLRSSDRVPFTSDPHRMYEWVRSLFADYERAVGKDAAPESVALGRALLGLAQWQVAALGEPVARRQTAARLCEEAAATAPEASMYRTMAAVTAPFAGGEATQRLTPPLAERLDAALLGAVALDSRNVLALTNLERLYSTMEQSSASTVPYTNDELKRRIGIVRGALESARR